MAADHIAKQLRDRLRWLETRRRDAYLKFDGLRQVLTLGWSHNPEFDRYRLGEFRAAVQRFDELIAQQQVLIARHRRKPVPSKPQRPQCAFWHHQTDRCHKKASLGSVFCYSHRDDRHAVRAKAARDGWRPIRHPADDGNIRWREMRPSDPESAWSMSCWNAFEPLSFGISMTDDDDFYKDATRLYRVPAVLNWPHGRIRPHVHRWNEGKPRHTGGFR